MFISPRYRLIFIHIQRTGGNSIERFFAERDPALTNRLPTRRDEAGREDGQTRIKHSFLSDIHAAMDTRALADYRIFTVVRNPFERMASWYAMFKHRTIEKLTQAEFPELWAHGERVEEFILPHTGCFTDFLAMPETAPHGLFRRFYDNQVDYLSYDSEVRVDHILRFERLAADFQSFVERLGIAGSLPHTNRSIRGDYRELYSEADRAEVARRFSRDLAYFDYAF